MQNSVKEKREELGLTQEELLIKSGVSRPTISMIENNALENIESKTMLRLAKALDCDIGDIFFKEKVVFTQQNNEQE